MLRTLEQTLRALSPGGAFAGLLLENVAIFALALLAGRALARRFAHRRVAPAPPPVERLEVLAATSCVLINTAVTFAGWLLWRAGVVRFRTDTGLRAALDVLVLLLVMDAAMYLLHRVAHVRALYPVVHGTHHRYEDPRPLTLFVLNPAETAGFGALWLVVITLYSASWVGMAAYLALNVVFGVVGHLGVEPLPDGWVHNPVLRWISTSTFHAQHHRDPAHNFGFYTLVWDRLAGTLSPRYAAEFGRVAARSNRAR